MRDARDRPHGERHGKAKEAGLKRQVTGAEQNAPSGVDAKRTRLSESSAETPALRRPSLPLTLPREQSRILIDLQVASHHASPGLLTVLTIWAIVLFFGVGLFAQSNGRVLSALTFGALCVAFAIFLILELGLLYTGMFRVSGAALQRRWTTSTTKCEPHRNT